MGKKVAYNPEIKWHRSDDGVSRPCKANQRQCRYSEHFDTETDAASPRQRQATSLPLNEKVRFDTALGEVPTNFKAEDHISLRESANIAKQTLAQTGHRPQSPLGKADIWLPGGQCISLQRETYDREGSMGRIGARYLVRYFPTQDSCEETIIPLNNKAEYALLVKQVDEYFSQASDNAAMKGEDSSKLVPYYKKTLQTIAEIETLSRGADRAYTNFGIDLFNHERPGELTLDMDYDNSTLQSYDISDALKGHAVMDKFPNDVSIHIKGAIPGVPDAKWSLDRLPEGDWLVGANSRRGVVSQRASSPEEARKIAAVIFKGHRALPETYQEQLHYVQQTVHEVESSIETYRETVVAKFAERRRFSENIAKKEANTVESLPKVAPETNSSSSTRGSFASRIGKLLS